jgi:oligoribonuclease
VKLVWLDIETSGLDERNGIILEVAVALTDDASLSIEHERNWVVHWDDITLDYKLGGWARHQHGQSGLLDAVRLSTTGMWAVRQELAAFIAQHVKEGDGVLAGNSVGTFDRVWLRYHAPEVVERLHYRVFDVSSLRMQMQLWAPTSRAGDLAAERSESGHTRPHRAMDDLRETIEEARVYREFMRQAALAPSALTQTTRRQQ